MAVTRLLVVPALMTSALLGWLAVGLAVPDPQYLLILLVSNATPTAINMQVPMQWK